MENNENKKIENGILNVDPIEEKSLTPKKSKRQKRIEEEGTFWERLSLRFRRRLLVNTSRTILIVLILIVIFICVNLLARESSFQFDFTSGKIYSLTDTSIDQVKDIDKEVTIYAYGFDDLDQEINLLKQYNDVNSNINYEIITTENNMQMIEDYDLESYGAAFVVKCGDRDITLYAQNFYSFNYSTYSYDSTPIYEESYVTNAIINVSVDEVIGVYFVTGHGEKGVDDTYYVSTSLEDKVYSCEDISLLTEDIPEDCGVLVILSPTIDFSTEESQKVKNYVEEGGNLFISMYKEDNTTDFTNFKSILDLYGVDVEYGVLYETGTNSYYGDNFYVIPEMSSYSSITKELVDSGYHSWFWSYTQSLVTEEIDTDTLYTEVEELMYTSEDCYNLTNDSDFANGISLDNAEEGSWVIGEKITRTDSSDDENPIISNLVIFANSNFYTDESIEYTSYYNPAAAIANETIFVSSIEDMTEQEDLIAIEKGTDSSTSFTVTVTTMIDLIVRIVIFIIPIIIILIGIIIWTYRRKKR